MEIFHIFTVTPIDVASYELPSVQYGDYYVLDESLDAAFSKLRDFSRVVGASEIYGIETVTSESMNGIILDAHMRYDRSEWFERHRHWANIQGVWEIEQTTAKKLEQHRYWANIQETYTLLAKGSESPEDFVSRRFAERYPGRSTPRRRFEGHTK